MSLSLKSGVESFVMAASYQPYDSLRDLIESLSALLSGSQQDVTVKWNGEPEEFDFRMKAEDDRVELVVVRYPNHRRRRGSGRIVFSFRGSKWDVCLPFWKELRDLHIRASVDVFESNWRRKFPQRELQQFTKLIRSLKREAREEGKW